MSASSTIAELDAAIDPVTLGQWHPVAPLEDLGADEHATPLTTVLLGQTISVGYADGTVIAWRRDDPDRRPLEVQVAYMYVWVCLDTPTGPIFELSEFAEPDRRNVHAGTIGVHVSAPRAIENFLDMGHFPFVHTGVLGIEPHTEVAEYNVRIDDSTGDVWATECVFYQPRAATTSVGGQMTDYLYRVPHPFCVVLYKTSPIDDVRMDVIGLFCQSVAPDRIRAHLFLSLLDPDNTDGMIRRFQQGIFGQDKPILENQYPKRLPLDPRAETPIRADKVAIAYRRRLSDQGITYGVIPAGG